MLWRRERGGAFIFSRRLATRSKKLDKAWMRRREKRTGIPIVKIESKGVNLSSTSHSQKGARERRTSVEPIQPIRLTRVDRVD